jgi:hypothetical protein
MGQKSTLLANDTFEVRVKLCVFRFGTSKEHRRERPRRPWQEGEPPAAQGVLGLPAGAKSGMCDVLFASKNGAVGVISALMHSVVAGALQLASFSANAIRQADAGIRRDW